MEMSTGVPATAYEPIRAPLDEEIPLSVLFIEDDPSVAEMYRIKLEADGYRVTVVDAHQVLPKLTPQVHPDLIFLDIRNPHRDRTGLLKKLRANIATKGIPVVILTDYSEDDLRHAGIRLHAGEYLVLSFSAPASLSPTLDTWAPFQDFA